MSIVNTKGVTLSDEEVAAFVPSQTDEQCANAYAEMVEEIYLHVDDLDETNCPPDRRFYRGDKEAWIYDSGNIVELVYVLRS